MLFSSTVFLLAFLPAVLAGYAVLSAVPSRGPQFLWLAVTSLFFYAYWNPPYLLLLLASIGANYGLGQALAARRDRRLLALGVAFNLGLIGLFKYAGFFVGNVNLLLGTAVPDPGLVLPLAISFFTFQQVAYLVDVYQGKVRDTDLLHYVLFVSFFPQLIAGPIVHHSEIIPQFERRGARRLHLSDMAAGAAIFVIGLQKKVVLADGMAIHADALFNGAGAAAPTLLPAWIGTLAYAFQIYFDFSGYSDMAIGLARMFGIVLPLNFASPYKATSIIDFWRRWHMTLSRFLKDYLYVPLGGNRHGRVRRYGNLMVTMVLGGLWHGASWNFVLWGGLHGLYLVINHAWHALRGPGRDGGLSGRVMGRALTFLAVVIAWVFFRAEDWGAARNVLTGLAGLNGLVLPVGWESALGWLAGLLGDGAVVFSPAPGFQPQVLVWLGGILALVFLAPNSQEILARAEAGGGRDARARGVPAAAWLLPFLGVCGLVGLLIVLARGNAGADFIYMVF
ncbi:MAG: MBOAT family protein [Rhodobacterales bacterium]|nr:MBOAT family protein [Rhodobacterales bacterium]